MATKREDRTYYVADFETLVLTEEEIQQGKRTYVWAWAICEVDNPNNVNYGTDIDSFFGYLKTLKSGSIVYFHNLKFDGDFIVSYMLSHDFRQVQSNKKMPDNTFTALVSEIGIWYSIQIKLGRKNIIINDSYKKLPFTVAKIAKSLGYEEEKGHIDYKTYRAEGGILTDEDKDYIRRDVQIVAKALKDVSFAYGMYRTTIASDCINYYKSITPKFDEWFPVLSRDVHEFCAQAYNGGWCNLQKKIAGKILGKNKPIRGFTLDRNSMHPSVMHSQSGNYFPWKEPVYFTGAYEPDEFYPLYIQHIRASFKLKPKHVPTVQVKGNLFTKSNEFIEETVEPIELVLTNVDLELFFENYEVFSYETINGYKFRACIGIFDKYIDYWYNYKEEATKRGDKVARMVAKLALNSFYGKWGSGTNASKQNFYLDDDGVLKHNTELDEKDGVYLPIAAFVTSYARRDLTQVILANYDHWAYSDTDSVKLYFYEDEEIEFKGVKIDKTKLGYWDIEDEWDQGVFLRQKTYATRINGKWNYKAAGMNDEVKENIKDIKQFKVGAEIDGKKMTRHVPGGIVITDSKFKIRKV